jgi:hypothetical protein
MLTVLNIVLILLVLMIAYWWANQGLFSAILHLLCVIAAGAITLAVWEPLNMRLLLRGNAFDDYAWGVSFILIFIVSLFVLRLIMDKTIGANVQIPPWANMAFGLPIGAAAGVLTMGLFLIGAGHIQSGREIMGFEGVARSRDQGGRVGHVNKLWAPVHTWTYEFYSFLSVGSLYPTFNDTPLRQYSPRLDWQASLVRDSAPAGNVDGRGKLSLRPSDARIEELIYCSDAQMRKFAVKVFFDSGSRDFGEQLTLSASQIRLIGEPQGTAEPPVAFPESWSQYDGWHNFDDVTHYITSEPAQASASIWIFFNARDMAGSMPKFIQIRGTRYVLPPRREVTIGDLIAMRGKSTAAPSTLTASIDNTASSIQSAIEMSNSIRPIAASTNNKPSGIELTEKYISGGDGDFIRIGADRPSPALTIKGILEPTGTRLVQVDISRESPATIFGNVQERAGNDAKLMLVDTHGRTYLPVGFIHEKPDNKTRIKVDFSNYSDTLDKLPNLPTAGGQRLKLLVSVTEGATIAGFKMGDVTVGKCALEVGKAATPKPEGEEKPTAGGAGAL